jgi:hypothetical protein
MSRFIISLYSFPVGDFELTTLDDVLNYLFNFQTEFNVCVETAMLDYLSESTHKLQVTSLLKTFNLTPTANFPTRIQK